MLFGETSPLIFKIVTIFHPYHEFMLFGVVKILFIFIETTMITCHLNSICEICWKRMQKFQIRVLRDLLGKALIHDLT